MESVVKAVGLPVNFSEEVEDDPGKKNEEKSPSHKFDNTRKRRYSSDEEYRSRERKDRYEIGSRYWGDEGTKSHRSNILREPDHHSKKRVDHRKNLDANSMNEEGVKEQKKGKEVDPIMTRTGGAYIPPARLRMMQAQITDKSSLAFQRLSWEALKKSIHGLINKVNVSNIPLIITSLFKENIVRGRGLLTRSIIQAQAASPTFTHVYAALAAVINSKFPNIGELLLTRLILQFRRGFRRNDKHICMSSTRFIAHLVNQQVAHELLALEILTLLLENATDDSVEVAVGFLKECGQKLGEVSPRGLTAVFDRLRHVLHEAELDKRVKYMIEVMFQ
ncbi:putative Pre-mRNA-splicing factor CWC22, partial [Daphnia magna]